MDKIEIPESVLDEMIINYGKEENREAEAEKQSFYDEIKK